MKTKSGTAAARNSGASENCVSANSRASIAGRAVAAESCARSIDCIGWQISVLQHGVFEPVAPANTAIGTLARAKPSMRIAATIRESRFARALCIRCRIDGLVLHGAAQMIKPREPPGARRGFSQARDSV